VADTELTEKEKQEILALKPDPQPKPAEGKPAEEKKTTYYGDETNYEDMSVKPNGTKGTVHARSKDGPPLDANGNLIKKTQKQKDEENRKKGREILDQMAKDKAAFDAKVAAKELARKERLKLQNIAGAEFNIKCEIPVVGKIETSKEVGRPKTPGAGDVSVDVSFDISKLSDKLPKGCSVGAKVRVASGDGVRAAGGSEETAKSAEEKGKTIEKAGDKIDEIKAESAKIRDTAAQMALDGKTPQEINAYATSAHADLIRKYGAQAGEYAVWGPNGKPPPSKE
jgi:hypothetical protein